MTTDFVPKIHPLTRGVEPDDPFELMMEPVVGGDPAVMLECLLQEFIWMGWAAPQLRALFRDPNYPLLCQLREFYGDEYVSAQVDGLLARTGVLRFTETIAEPDDEDDHDHEPRLVQLMPFASERQEAWL